MLTVTSFQFLTLPYNWKTKDVLNSIQHLSQWSVISFLRCHLIPVSNFTETTVDEIKWNFISRLTAGAKEQNKKKFCISFSISSKSEKTTTLRGTSFSTSLHLSQYRADQNLPRRRQSVSLLGYNLYSSYNHLSFDLIITNQSTASSTYFLANTNFLDSLKC